MWEIFSGFDLPRLLFYSVIHQETVGTNKRGFRLIHSSIKQSANLMNPAATNIAIDPGLLGQRIIFEFLQVGLRHFCAVIQDDGFFRVYCFITCLAPMVRLSSFSVISCTSLNSLHSTLSLAVKHRWFKTAFLLCAQRASLSSIFELLLRRFDTWKKFVSARHYAKHIYE